MRKVAKRHRYPYFVVGGSKRLDRSFNEHVKVIVSDYEKSNISEEWLRYYLAGLTATYVSKRVTSHFQRSLSKVLQSL